MKTLFNCVTIIILFCFTSKAQQCEKTTLYFHHHISICQFTSTIDEDYYFYLKEDGSFVFGKISFGFTGKFFQAFKNEHFGLACLRNDSLFITIVKTKNTSGDGTAINTNVSNEWRESELSIPTAFVVKNGSLIPVNGKFPPLKRKLKEHYDILEKQFQVRSSSQKPKTNYLKLR